MHTTATLHAHPACTSIRVFEIRYLARKYGCAFIASKPPRKTHQPYTPIDPNGGRAA
ncbi:hypothetical protein C4K14_2091 [Pseudomonas chlororaphis subsp. aureofaciens]|nr:hypothetical protein C4K14_2091 [Pseudomonas chlororaphis subsp. aureofaciens]